VTLSYPHIVDRHRLLQRIFNELTVRHASGDPAPGTTRRPASLLALLLAAGLVRRYAGGETRRLRLSSPGLRRPSFRQEVQQGAGVEGQAGRKYARGYGHIKAPRTTRIPPVPPPSRAPRATAAPPIPSVGCCRGPWQTVPRRQPVSWAEVMLDNVASEPSIHRLRQPGLGQRAPECLATDPFHGMYRCHAYWFPHQSRPQSRRHPAC